MSSYRDRVGEKPPSGGNSKIRVLQRTVVSNKGVIKLERWCVRWASRLERRECWDKSRRNSADNLHY